RRAAPWRCGSAGRGSLHRHARRTQKIRARPMQRQQARHTAADFRPNIRDGGAWPPPYPIRARADVAAASARASITKRAKVRRGRFITSVPPKYRFPAIPNHEGELFSLDVGGFEDRPPVLDLGLVVGRERLRILILARRNFLAEIGEPLAHAGIG